ncbi:unnamed protein product [Euphydryas editha]|uniref:Prostaglandin reductase 1 n=1 Tax=Euphydryas editha TaxID=104508 RepID=A0AAU9UGZ8_EUPED|nr:unnamed protein product [Euphydryas editha]
MVKARKYVVKKYFEGLPKRSDYEIVEEELPPLKDGELLVKSEWLGVDPYFRAYNKFFPVPYDQFGYQIVSMENPIEVTWKVPDLGDLSPAVAIGVAGATGISAYFGFLEICKPIAGETVVVTGAAGAVGSVVGQIAKIKGCHVIGFAGSYEKVKWLEEDLGFDKAFNYKTVDVAKVLREAAPSGIDCFFDNVGGDLSNIIMSQMNKFGRISICGYISSYNDEHLPKVTIFQPLMVLKQLKAEGFIVRRWIDRWPEAIEQLVSWLKNGQIKSREHVTYGFDNVIDAFVGMLKGENYGKAVVKI